jgi:hypothetical protein
MENDDFLKDEFLSKLIREIPEESPSDAFVSNVMREIVESAETEKVKRPFLWYLKASLPYVLISLAVLVFFFTSDLPLSDSLPGKDFFTISLLPYFNTFIDSFSIITDKLGNTTLPLLIGVAALLFFVVDKLLLGRRMSHQPTN